jgi:metal-responsive CopG/Arc/MetJ family transcriptional regulator
MRISDLPSVPNEHQEREMAKVRLNIEVSEDLVKFLDNLADKEDTTRTEIVRRALSVLKAFQEQREAGRKHIGFADDPTKLDAELVGILNAEASRKDDKKAAA